MEVQGKAHLNVIKKHILCVVLLLKLFIPNALFFLLTQLLLFQHCCSYDLFSFFFSPPSEPFLGSFTRILIAVVKFISLPFDSCLLAFVKGVDGLSSFPNRQVFPT